MKTVLKILLLLLAMGYIIYAIVRFSRTDDEAVCTSLYISIDDSELPSPIDTSYLHTLLVENKFFPEGQLVSNISLAGIDSMLKNNPFINKSLVYFDAGNRLCIEVTPNHPVMHVIPEGEASYYLCSEGEIAPDNMSCKDLPLASGHITRQWASRHLTTLARIMKEDTIWNNLIGQIYVSPDSTITLTTRLSEHSVYMGRATNMRDKLARLKKFYTDAMPQVGWNVYEELNLEYDKQIIATRKKRMK